jgi:hypothetical protein
VSPPWSCQPVARPPSITKTRRHYWNRGTTPKLEKGLRIYKAKSAKAEHRVRRNGPILPSHFALLTMKKGGCGASRS